MVIFIQENRTILPKNNKMFEKVLTDELRNGTIIPEDRYCKAKIKQKN